jgi:hypothetical protein
MFRDARHSLLLILAPLLPIAAVSYPLRAQDPIRVESNQVLVRVVVLNDRLYTRLKKAQLEAHQHSAQLVDNLTIRGSSAIAGHSMNYDCFSHRSRYRTLGVIVGHGANPAHTRTVCISKSLR